MKKLRDLKPLARTIETISMMDLRKQPGEVIDNVQFGRTYIIEKQGKPVAVLTPLPGQTLTIKVAPDGSFSYALDS